MKELKYKAAIVTVSDRASKGEMEDASGGILKKMLEKNGYEVIKQSVIPDEEELIEAKLKELSKTGEIALILTTGGTGFSPRDVTPEATKNVCDKMCPGIAEAVRNIGAKYTKRSYLSRGASGIINKTLIINLPGSPDGASQSLEGILDVLPHGLEMLRSDPKTHHTAQ